MDLNRLQQFSRERLEAEARRVGVREAHLLTRAELIVAILREGAGFLRPLREARKLFGALAETARELQKLTSARPTTSSSRASARAPVGVTPAAPSRSGALNARPSARRTPSERTSERTSASAPSSTTLAASSASYETSTKKTPDLAANLRTSLHASQAEHAQVIGRSTQSTSEQPAASGARATTRSFIAEPIRTHSMARLLAAQGHTARAVAIYDELIAKEPANRELLEEAARLRRGLPASELPTTLTALTKPTERTTDELPTSPDDHVSCTEDASGALHVRWSTSDAGRSRAAALLGEPAELSLRVVLVKPDRDRVVQSLVTEHGPIEARGEWSARLDPEAVGQRCVASVGLRTRERFVSIAHGRTQKPE